MRWNSPESRTSRSTAVIRCVPRLVPTTAWISSRITVASPASIARPRREVSRMLRLSGVVMRISGGRRAMRARSSAGVSPERVRTRTVRHRLAGGLEARAQLLERQEQVAPDVGVERPERRDVEHPHRPPGQAPVSSRSSAHRKAASVLPLPVGAVTRTCSPAAIAATRGAAPRWARRPAPRTTSGSAGGRSGGRRCLSSWLPGTNASRPAQGASSALSRGAGRGPLAPGLRYHLGRCRRTWTLASSLRGRHGHRRQRSGGREDPGQLLPDRGGVQPGGRRHSAHPDVFVGPQQPECGCTPFTQEWPTPPSEPPAVVHDPGPEGGAVRIRARGRPPQLPLPGRPDRAVRLRPAHLARPPDRRLAGRPRERGSRHPGRPPGERGRVGACDRSTSNAGATWTPRAVGSAGRTPRHLGHQRRRIGGPPRELDLRHVRRAARRPHRGRAPRRLDRDGARRLPEPGRAVRLQPPLRPADRARPRLHDRPGAISPEPARSSPTCPSSTLSGGSRRRL